MVRTFYTVPFYGRLRQIWRISGIGGMNRFTKVVASITELGAAPGGPPEYPLLGDATLSVFNVSPNDNGSVYIRTWVDWGTPLPFRLTLFVDP